MGYVYSALWVIISIMLFFRFRKENKVVYILSAYFLFLGVWWFIDEFIKGLNLMDGTYVWILRIVSAVMLGLTAIVYLFERKKHFPVKDDTTTETEENP